jgi:acyl carrier protein
MSELDNLSHELRDLLIRELNLKIASDELSLDEPLLSGKQPTKMAIDSLDMLSLVMAIEDRYGVRLPQTTEELSGIFASIRSIAQSVERLQAEAQA